MSVSLKPDEKWKREREGGGEREKNEKKTNHEREGATSEEVVGSSAGEPVLDVIKSLDYEHGLGKSKHHADLETSINTPGHSSIQLRTLQH